MIEKKNVCFNANSDLATLFRILVVLLLIFYEVTIISVDFVVFVINKTIS